MVAVRIKMVRLFDASIAYETITSFLIHLEFDFLIFARRLEPKALVWYPPDGYAAIQRKLYNVHFSCGLPVRTAQEDWICRPILPNPNEKGYPDLRNVPKSL
jgi:hypothetical protein